MIKKIVSVLFLSVLLLSLCVVFTGCSAPKVDEIYDRVVELVERSYELNTLFYGAGLPVYKTGSDYADFTNLYYGVSYAGSYEIVNDHAGFYSFREIMDKAERVYSKDYLEKVIYPMAFTGYAISDGAGGSQFSHARFMEDEKWIYQSIDAENYLDGIRVYDYSTMKVVSPSNGDACYVTMNSWLDSDPSNVLSVRLRLVKQSDGLWYLDSFTG